MALDEMIFDEDAFNNYLEKKINGEELDDWFFFDKHVEEFDEDMIRKYKDFINIGDLFDRRHGNGLEHFSTDFIREMLSWGLVNEDEKGYIVSWESGLYDYVNGKSEKVENEELLNEFIDEVKNLYTDIYGPNCERMKVNKERERLTKYIKN